MIIWAFLIVVMAVISYLSDTGVMSILRDVRTPVLGVSMMSLLLMICGLGMMCRVGYMVRKGEKENLKERVHELEKKLKEKQASVS